MNKTTEIGVRSTRLLTTTMIFRILDFLGVKACRLDTIDTDYLKGKGSANLHQCVPFPLPARSRIPCSEKSFKCPLDTAKPGDSFLDFRCTQNRFSLASKNP